MQQSLQKTLKHLAFSTLALALLLAVPASAGMQAQFSGTTLSFQTDATFESGFVRISGPNGTLIERNLGGDLSVALHRNDGAPLADGLYTYELTLTPRVDRTTREAMNKANTAERGLEQRQLRDDNALRASGSFRIQGGTTIDPNATEEQQDRTDSNPADKAQVFVTDVVVQGSLCAGFDCVNGESFGFDTIRLKENNLRIHFQDTSTSASFPTNDWRIVANDSSNGGANYLGIEDSNAGRMPFRVEAGAPANALYVEADGDVGIKTANPVVDIHVVEGNTPTLRLEQDGSDGFTPQTWDVAGNEANFFIRDATNGSALAFRIEPGADESSIHIDDGNRVGFGTNNPATDIHVRKSGNPEWRMENASNGNKWTTRLNSSGSLVFTRNDNASASIQFVDDGEFRVVPPGGNATFQADANGDLRLRAPTDALTGQKFFFTASNGNLTITGTLNSGSDVNSKHGFEELDGAEVLSRVLSLPITEWSYKNDDASIRHIGPMAQDFHAAFGLGQSETTISVTDMGGISLAAIQALHAEVEEKDAKIDDLEQRMAQLEAALLALQAQQ